MMCRFFHEIRVDSHYELKTSLNRKVYLIAGVLVFVTGIISMTRLHVSRRMQADLLDQNHWRIRALFGVSGKGDPVKIRMTLPQSNAQHTIFNEQYESEGMSFGTEQRSTTGNRMGVWRSDFLSKPITVKYYFSVRMEQQETDTPPTDALVIPEAELQKWLKPSKHIQSRDPLIVKMAESLITGKTPPLQISQAMFDFVRASISYKVIPGSQNALHVLATLKADCGGQSRLLCALSRAAGVPSRLVGGIILEEGTKKTTHVWVENWIDGRWFPMDVTNNHIGKLPDTYLELYRGDVSLIRHKGFEDFNYSFRLKKYTAPPIQNPWSLNSLPLPAQDIVKIFLLICLGTVCTVFFRVFIGIPTFGTFTPILIAVAFIKIPWLLGTTSLILALFLGWLLRVGLDKLYILALPRISIVFIIMVACILGMILFGQYLGHKTSYSMLMFPMVILTWSVERFSMHQMEDGLLAALKITLGTIVTSSAIYFFLKMHFLQSFLFMYPEILLTLLALHLIMGRYTGYRLTELFRFASILGPRPK